MTVIIFIGNKTRQMTKWNDGFMQYYIRNSAVTSIV